MSAKKNKGRPVRWTLYTLLNPIRAMWLLKHLAIQLEIPSAQSKETNDYFSDT